MRTRQSIQEHALRLFFERGYDATTVSDVAAAAEVSSMTVFRYFPTKEDLVLADEFDPLIVQRLEDRPAGEPLLRRLGMGLIQTVAELSATDRDLLLTRVRLVLSTPALRARQAESQYVTQKVIVDALGDETDDPEQAFRVWVVAGTCLAAASAAITRWVEEDGRPDLRELMERVLAIMAEEASR
jgi:AcrR family transcriptional regulator